MKTKAFLIALFTTVAVGSSAMTLSEVQDRALFLTDRMAYDLGLSTYQYDEVYQINYDYLYQVNYLLDDILLGDSYATLQYRNLLEVRNNELRYVLYYDQWNSFSVVDYFFAPIVFAQRMWRFAIFSVDSRLNYFHFGRPHIYTSYRGGNYITFQRGRGFYAPKQFDNRRMLSTVHRNNNSSAHRNNGRQGNSTMNGSRTVNRGSSVGTGNNSRGGSSKVTTPSNGSRSSSSVSRNSGGQRKSSSVTNSRSTSRSTPSSSSRSSRSTSSRSTGGRTGGSSRR